MSDIAVEDGAAAAVAEEGAVAEEVATEDEQAMVYGIGSSAETETQAAGGGNRKGGNRR